MMTKLKLGWRAGFGAAVCALTVGLGATAPTHAQTAQIMGQIVVYSFDYCPINTAEANGDLLDIRTNAALFSLYGTMYGGDGITNFALPDLRGRFAVGAGSGPGLTPHDPGERFGANSVTLSVDQMPAHNHSLGATTNPPLSNDPTDRVFATFASVNAYAHAGSNTVTMSTQTEGATGGGNPISVQDPGLSLTVCIVVGGIYPSRS